MILAYGCEFAEIVANISDSVLCNIDGVDSSLCCIARAVEKMLQKNCAQCYTVRNTTICDLQYNKLKVGDYLTKKIYSRYVTLRGVDICSRITPGIRNKPAVAYDSGNPGVQFDQRSKIS
jgi:hypothetical protein